MKNLFNSVRVRLPKYSLFDLTHDVKMSCNMGQLVPIMCLDCVPGDKMSLGGQSLIRMAPMVAPPMHRINTFIHYWFVPKRLLWDNYSNWYTSTKVGGVLPSFPTIKVGYNEAYSKLADYLGIPPVPPGVTEIEHVNAMPFAAYQLIWKEFYRDQDLQPLLNEDFYKLSDGDNTAAFTDLGVLRYRDWKHDYYSSARPTAQKGPAVDIPLGDVILDPDTQNPGLIRAASDHNTLEAGLLRAGDSAGGASDGHLRGDSGTAFERDAVYDPNGTLITEPTEINDLRRAFALQRYLELLARGGSRLAEVIRNFFGVYPEDSRLQRPEYITGSQSPMIISEVLNTTGIDGELPQGNMSGHGASVNTGKFGRYHVKEPGFIIGILSVMPEPAYMQGISKMWSKFEDPTQEYNPMFANIGEQPIQNREIYAYQGNASVGTFGYTPRYAEYKYEPSRVAGDFRSSLDFWHLARKFDNPPQLNDEFVVCNPSTRIFAVTDTQVDHLWCQIVNTVKALRPMPKYGTPI